MSTTETPPPPPPADGGPRVDGDAARDLSRLRRTTKASPEGRYIAGVAGGLARHLDIDPLVVRVALVVLIFFGGAGLLVYIAAWLLVPEEYAATATIRIDPRSRAVLLWVALGLAGLAVIGDSIGGVHLPWPLIVLGLVVLWLATRKNVAAGWAAATGGTPAPVAAPPPSEGSPAESSEQREDAAATTATAVAAPPYAPPPPPRPVREPDPRKTGPLLFWFTLALIALAEGILGVIDVAGAHIAAPAYPALALGIIGVMLVVGAFWGRAGGLILVGLVTAVILAGVTAADQAGPRQTIVEVPTTSAAVAPSYSMHSGHLTLDLSQVADVPGLSGRTVDLSGRVGQISVIVPRGTGVDLRAQVHGPGAVRAFGDNHGGLGVTYDHVYPADPGQPTMVVSVDLKVGEIDIDEPSGVRG